MTKAECSLWKSGEDIPVKSVASDESGTWWKEKRHHLYTEKQQEKRRPEDMKKSNGAAAGSWTDYKDTGEASEGGGRDYHVGFHEGKAWNNDDDNYADEEWDSLTEAEKKWRMDRPKRVERNKKTRRCKFFWMKVWMYDENNEPLYDEHGERAYQLNEDGKPKYSSKCKRGVNCMFFHEIHPVVDIIHIICQYTRDFLTL